MAGRYPFSPRVRRTVRTLALIEAGFSADQAERATRVRKRLRSVPLAPRADGPAPRREG